MGARAGASPTMPANEKEPAARPHHLNHRQGMLFVLPAGKKKKLNRSSNVAIFFDI